MRKFEEFQKLTTLEHVLLRPGRYLGSITMESTEDWVLSPDGLMELKPIEYHPALLKMFDEVFTNSVDHSKRPEGKNLTRIDVTLDDGVFSVKDNGGIPVAIHPKYKQYIPEMIFGDMRAGSNFDDSVDSKFAGQNGEGASLTNIFSTEFIVETADGKKKFLQRFENNMSKKSEPLVTNSKNSFTKITWIPDYDRLGTSIDSGNNFDKVLMRVHAVAATNPHLTITFNGKRIKYKSFKEYIEMFDVGEVVYEANDDWSVGVAKSPTGAFNQVSFVNCGETYMGGTHIDYVVEPIVAKIREFIKKKHKVDVRPAAIRSQMMVFIDANIVRPRYNSQTKEHLITDVKDFKTSFEISDKSIKKILNSDIVSSILDWVHAKEREKELAEARKQAKKNKTKKVAKHIKANSRNRMECSLYITEGESALNKWIDVRDIQKHGAFPLKGKPMNVTRAKLSDIVGSDELGNIMAIIGLEIGKKAVREELNYGKSVRIMTDADPDGAGAITCLLINCFATFWPELFEWGYIEIVRSPIVVATKGNEIKRFIEIDDFRAANLDTSKWNIAYMKGLGSLSDEDYDLIVNSPTLEVVKLDNISVLNMAFGEDTDIRKRWLMATDINDIEF